MARIFPWGILGFPKKGELENLKKGYWGVLLPVFISTLVFGRLHPMLVLEKTFFFKTWRPLKGEKKGAWVLWTFQVGRKGGFLWGVFVKRRGIFDKVRGIWFTEPIFLFTKKGDKRGFSDLLVLTVGCAQGFPFSQIFAVENVPPRRRDFAVQYTRGEMAYWHSGSRAFVSRPQWESRPIRWVEAARCSITHPEIYFV